MPIDLHDRPTSLRIAIIAIFLATIGAFLGSFAIDAETLNRLSWEDGLIENAGSFFFLVAAGGFFAVFLLSFKGGPDSSGFNPRRAVVFGLLAALMFVCFGEEISWGQRIFGWETPAALSSANAQNEINFHNLYFVHQWNENGTEKGFVGKLVNMNRLFSIFWLAVFVVLPVSTRLSNRVRNFITKTGIPNPPLWAGFLFLSNFVVYKVLATMYSGSLRAHALDEIKEANYALIYALVALVALALALGARKKGPGSPNEGSTAA